MNRNDDRLARRPAGRRRRPGFTVIELLVVISIIALLVGILMPSLAMSIRAVRISQSKTTCRMIDGGVKQYNSDFQAYPPSSTSEYSGLRGSELVALFLTGYGPAAGTGFLFTGDLNPGPGFRLVQGGKVYGPYGGAENIKTGTFGSSKRVFLDGFGNPFLYYCYQVNPATGVSALTIGDNADSEISPYKPGYMLKGPDNVSYFRDSAGHNYRSDFAVISLGPEVNEIIVQGSKKYWQSPPSTGGACHNITNFFPE